MRRRDLISAAALLPVASAAAWAQPVERVRRIGYLTAATGNPEDIGGVEQIRALVGGLREFGWIDGRNIVIDHRFSGTGPERIRANAKDLVGSQPDLIITVGGLVLTAVLAETRTIPVVFTVVSDPVASGQVASLARPGGNATGIASNEAPIAGKWLELLKEVAPEVRRVMVPAADTSGQRLLSKVLAATAPALGLSLVIATVQDMADYEREIDAFAGEPDGGLVVLSNPITGANRSRISALAARHRLPAVYNYPVYARSGGLLAYGPDTTLMVRDAARLADRILRGANPGDLPVEQPTHFLLAVNLNTARGLGLTIPQSILVRADEVIE